MAAQHTMMETLVETGPDLGKSYHPHHPPPTSPLYPSPLSPSRKQRRHKGGGGGLQHYYQYHLDHDSYIQDASPRRDKAAAAAAATAAAAAAMSGIPIETMYNTPFSTDEQFSHAQNPKAAPFIQSAISPNDVNPLGLQHAMFNQMPKQGNMGGFSIHTQAPPRHADLKAGLIGGQRWAQHGPMASKRRRTPQQMQRLEDVFIQKANPTEAEKKQLADELNMDLKQVQTWFQNKRQRVKTQENAKGVQELTQENQQLLEKVRELEHELARFHDRNRSLKQQIAVRKQKMDELREAAQDLLDEYYAVVQRNDHEEDRQYHQEESEREQQQPQQQQQQQQMQRSMSNMSDRDLQRARMPSSGLPEAPASVSAYSARDEGAATSTFPSFSQAADDGKSMIKAEESVSGARASKRDHPVMGGLEMAEQPPTIGASSRSKSDNPGYANTVSELLRKNSDNYDKSVPHAEFRNEEEELENDE